MGTKYLAAHTTVEQFNDSLVGHQGPPYINFTEDVARRVVIVRGREKAGPGEVYGRDFNVEIPTEAFTSMLRDALIAVTAS